MKVATVLVLLAVCAVSAAKPPPSGPPPSGPPPSGPPPSGPPPSGPPPSGSPTFNDKKQAALKTLLRSLSLLGKVREHANEQQQSMDGVKGFLGEGVTANGMDKRDFTDDGQAQPRTSPKPRSHHQKRNQQGPPRPAAMDHQRSPPPPAAMDPFMDGVMGMLMEGVTANDMDKRDFTDDGQAQPRTSPKPRSHHPHNDKKDHVMGMPTMMYPGVYPSYDPNMYPAMGYGMGSTPFPYDPMMFPGVYPSYDPYMGNMYPGMGNGMGSTPFPNYSGMDMNAAIDTLYQACMQRQENMMTSYEWGLFDQVKDDICRTITDNDTWAADTVAAALLD